MKIKSMLLMSLLAVILVAQTADVRGQSDAGELVVHEWGTFTSLQGANGDVIPWKPLQTSVLPKFVYNWAKSGLPVYPISPVLFFGKGSIITLQRMETPVVFF